MVRPRRQDQFLVAQLGLAWMVFATLFPLGLLQLYESVNHGYFEARTSKYLDQRRERFSGMVAAARATSCSLRAACLPVLYLCWLGIRHTVPPTLAEEPETVLFAEVSEP